MQIKADTLKAQYDKHTYATKKLIGAQIFSLSIIVNL